MAEAEVTISYRPAPITAAYWALLVLLPGVGLFALWTMVGVLISAVQSNVSPGPIALFLIGELAVVCGLLAALVVASDKTIFVTKEGIAFPFWLCPSAWSLRVQKHWADLQTVHYQAGNRHGVLQLVFTDGSSARLDLNLLNRWQVEDLIVAIDVWGRGSDAFPALLEARSNICGEALEGAHGFTEMWEEELARRFGPTSFIPLEPGHKLREGHFEVERQLAFGGFSAIYLLRDQQKNRYVLKEAVVPPGDAELTAKAMQMLEREARFLSQLSHPNIARVLDTFVEDGRTYLLIEYLEGQDLRRLIKEYGPQDEESVLEWAAQMVEILVYLHQQPTPIVHRDFTPDNLILREDGAVALIDFGAANQFAGTATGTMIGKQAYISPEQLRGKASPQSDIYAFGGTLYFLLTGQDPEPLSVSHPSLTNPKVSAQLDALVAACTEMECADRVKSAMDLRITLAEIRSGARQRTRR